MSTVLLERARRLQFAAFGLAVLLAGAVGIGCVSQTTRCAGGLDPIEAPPNWQALPIPADQGGFEVRARYVGKALYGHYVDGVIADPELCAYETVSLDGWLAGSTMSGARSPERVAIRKANEEGVYVASGTDNLSPSPVLIAAFRRSMTKRIAWRSPSAPMALFVLAFAMMVSAAGAVFSWLRIRRASRLLDRTAWHEGNIDQSGRLRVDHDVVQHDTKNVSGRVLARLAPTAAGSYRDAASPRALDVIAADLPDRLAVQAGSAARRAILAAVVAIMLSAALGACHALYGELADIY